MTDRAWQETDSRAFIDRGRIYTPRRDELRDAFLDLIPAELDDEFQVVELAPGAGWLSAAILGRFPHASILALDGSEEMLAETERALASFPGRWETRIFQLLDRDWRKELPTGLRAIVSSLAIHHLKGSAKRDLFADLHDHLAPGGALLIADLVEPASEPARRHMARAWDEDVERQSLEFSGSPAAWEHFRDDHWNLYIYPDDEMDFPSPLVDQIDWLRQTRYTRIDVPWARAGHTLIAAYRKQERRTGRLPPARDPPPAVVADLRVCPGSVKAAEGPETSSQTAAGAKDPESGRLRNPRVNSRDNGNRIHQPPDWESNTHFDHGRRWARFRSTIYRAAAVSRVGKCA